MNKNFYPILLTGGNGLFGSTFLKKNKRIKKRIISPSSLELNITNKKKVSAYLNKYKPKIIIPLVAEKSIGKINPIYKSLDGWQQNTFAIKKWNQLPVKAKEYILFLEKTIKRKISIVSTGPDRMETIDVRKLLTDF